MPVSGNFRWVAALLVAAALVSLAVALRDLDAPRPLAAPDASLLAGRNEAAAASAPVTTAEIVPTGHERIGEQMEVLRQGLLAAGGAGSPAARGWWGAVSPSRVLIGSALAGVLLGSVLGGLLASRYERRRRRAIPPVSDADACVEATTSVRPERAATASETLGASEPRGAGISESGSAPAGIWRRGGLLPWTGEARAATVDGASIEQRLRSLERLSLRLARKLDDETEGASVRTGGDAASPDSPTGPPLRRVERAAGDAPEESARLAGFGRALADAQHKSAEAGAPNADRARLRRAVRRLAREGWPEDRITRRLRLSPEEVARALRQAGRSARREERAATARSEESPRRAAAG